MRPGEGLLISLDKMNKVEEAKEVLIKFVEVYGDPVFIHYGLLTNVDVVTYLQRFETEEVEVAGDKEFFANELWIGGK